MTNPNQQVEEGWARPYNSRKWHYFYKTMSLCNRWMFGGKLDKELDQHPDNCKTCQRIKLAKGDATNNDN